MGGAAGRVNKAPSFSQAANKKTRMKAQKQSRAFLMVYFTVINAFSKFTELSSGVKS